MQARCMRRTRNEPWPKAEGPEAKGLGPGSKDQGAKGAGIIATVDHLAVEALGDKQYVKYTIYTILDICNV